MQAASNINLRKSSCSRNWRKCGAYLGGIVDDNYPILNRHRRAICPKYSAPQSASSGRPMGHVYVSRRRGTSGTDGRDRSRPARALAVRSRKRRDTMSLVVRNDRDITGQLFPSRFISDA
jgi:hypothetical protein